MTKNKLTTDEQRIIIEKGTEPPFSGEYNNFFENGIFCCRQCSALLYRSIDKFNANCGWPSFDNDIAKNVSKMPDPDGHRIEIICKQCKGHLGHIFEGEQHTPNNTRHCVNSLSINFVAFTTLFEQARTETSPYFAAIFAAGCFWHVEAEFSKQKGVMATQVGYTGGQQISPSYQDVCSGQTGHAEAIIVIADKSQTNYQQLCEAFFTMHDASQRDRQGVDIGSQYRSAIFPLTEQQRETATHIISTKQCQGETIVTSCEIYEQFWPAEAYHQQYNRKKIQT